MPSFENKSYYQLLGVDPEASTQEIKEAYKNIARAYHPDSNFYDEIIGDGGQGVAASVDNESAVFKKITEAYNTLVNAERRKEYDRVFPKGLRDWDDPDATIHFGVNDFSGTGTIYRPMGDTGTFRRSQFGLVSSVDEDRLSAFDKEVKGGPIRPIMISRKRSIMPIFIGLLLIGFLAGGVLAYLAVRGR